MAGTIGALKPVDVLDYPTGSIYFSFIQEEKMKLLDF